MTTSSIDKLDSSYYSTESTTKSSSSDSSSVVGKDEFLQLLITQLQNQDPLDPVENEEFAVNLAQFSQVEQLISINDTLEGMSSSSSSESEGLATYLGHQVLLKDNTIEVSNNDGGDITFKLPSSSSEVNVQLLDDSKNIVETISLGELEAGEYTATLNNLSTSSGSFSANVVYLNSSGSYSTVSSSRCGTVSGFIPGDENPLLIGEQQISLSDISEVRA